MSILNKTYKTLSIQDVSNDVYNIIYQLHIIKNVPISQIVYEILTHAHQPKYVPNTNKQYVSLLRKFNYIFININYLYDLISNLSNVLSSYQQAQNNESPYTRFMIPKLNILLSKSSPSEIYQAKKKIATLSNTIFYIKSDITKKVNLSASTSQNRYSIKYLKHLVSINTHQTYEKIKPPHHISLKVPNIFYRNLHNLCKHNHISYTKLLTLATSQVHIPTVLVDSKNSKHLDKSKKYNRYASTLFYNIINQLLTLRYNINELVTKTPKQNEENEKISNQLFYTFNIYLPINRVFNTFQKAFSGNNNKVIDNMNKDYSDILNYLIKKIKTLNFVLNNIQDYSNNIAREEKGL